MQKQIKNGIDTKQFRNFNKEKVIKNPYHKMLNYELQKYIYDNS